MISTGSSNNQQQQELKAQADLAESQQEQAVQASLGADTLNMLRLFGQQNAMSGAGVTVPMSSIVGSAPHGAVGR